jgi:valyl-tRNA synthetase
MEKRYDHIACEEQAQRLWHEQKTHIAENNPGPLYSIDTPPPTVSGNLHIGHIFSYTQTDIIARYKRMSGYSVFYPFGFDDNGLPTERYVEKKRDISAHRMSRSEFIKICLEETKLAGEQFKRLWQRMGLSVDWNACYSTISDEVRKISQASFIELYKKGFVYRKYEPAPYCTTCRTSVAQAELDDEQKSSHFNDIVFTDEQGHDLIIGTTRPELLPACVAVLYNPCDIRYQHLKGTRACVPVFDLQVPILEDERVSIEKGTGLVMCCTFGDKTDIAWFKKFNLPYTQIIGLDGKWLAGTGILAGLTAHKAREQILEELKNRGLLLRQTPITHAVNVHERCKKEIEFLALPQWFLNILEYKDIFLKLGDTINWYPAFMKTRYHDWVANLGWDWCLSRQRFFGIPFPVWHCSTCHEILLPREEQLPIDPQETSYQGSCSKCGNTTITPDTDVMDTWNTSSLTPYICYRYFNQSATDVLHTKELAGFIPMSMRPQAHDIIRTWAFDTIVKTWMHTGTIPWSNIVISGHVLSDKKGKISKSKEHNALAPENLLATYPADAIRYWTASGGLGQDIAFSDAQIKIGNRLITKLWNAFLFIETHGDQTLSPELVELGGVNEWILHHATLCFNHYQQYFARHEFGLALDQLEKFFWAYFCDNYLELIKDLVFKPERYPAALVSATRWTLSRVGLRILQLYAPYIPHVTESIYQQLYISYIQSASIHQTKFTEIQKPCEFIKSAHVMESVIGIIAQVRKIKSEYQLSLKTELALLSIYHNDRKHLALLKNYEQILKGVTHAQMVGYLQEPHVTSSLEKHEDNTYHIKIAL